MFLQKKINLTSIYNFPGRFWYKTWQKRISWAKWNSCAQSKSKAGIQRLTEATKSRFL